MNVNKRKLYIALMLYILSMAALLVSRLLDFYEICFFAGTSIVLMVFSLICKVPNFENKEKKLRFNGRAIYSTLIFSAWLLVAIPMMLLGDYLASVSGLGYDVGFLGNGLGNLVLWVGVILSAVAYEVFFRGVIYSGFSKVLKSTKSMLVTSMSFAVFFLDIRLIFPLFLLNIALTMIGVISNKHRYLFSLIAPAFIVVFLSLISGENAGALFYGLPNIVGMLFIFTSISLGLCYGVHKKYNETKSSYIEILTVSIVLIFFILIGSLIITI